MVMMSTQGVRNFLLDLSEVKYADSSGLSALLRGKAIATEAGGIFVIYGVTEHVGKLISITQLDRVFTILANQQEAIEAAFMHEIEAELVDEDEDDDED
jgi:anti-anti-sigma factor